MSCHTCWLNYLTWVWLWCGRTVGRTVTWLPNFLGWVHYHIFLLMVLRYMRFACESSAINIWYTTVFNTAWTRSTSKLAIWISGRFRQFYFLQKTLITKIKRPKNQDLYLYSVLKTEKRKPFFHFQSPLWKLEESAPFSHEKRDIFRICIRYKVKQFSWVIFISHESQKSWKEKFLEFFQLFAFFFKVKKSRPFPAFFVWSFWAERRESQSSVLSTDNCQKWQVIVSSKWWR